MFIEQVFLDDVKCQGHEKNLGDCMHREWLTSNCNAGEAAGVVCHVDSLQSELAVDRSYIDPIDTRQRGLVRCTDMQ